MYWRMIKPVCWGVALTGVMQTHTLVVQVWYSGCLIFSHFHSKENMTHPTPMRTTRRPHKLLSSIALLTVVACQPNSPTKSPTQTVEPNVPAPALQTAITTTPVVSGVAIQGSGISATHTQALNQTVRNVTADVSATFIYDANIGQKITVTTDQNLQDQVKVSLEHGELKVFALANNIQPKTPIQITWGGQAPEHLNVKGSAKIILRSINTQQLSAVISGSGEINVDGTVQQLNIDISGSGGFVSPQLSAKKANIHVSGSANIVTQVTESVVGSISGSGSVVLTGQPSVRQLTSSGSAQIVYQ